jgi:ankyrin repeat protein
MNEIKYYDNVLIIGKNTIIDTHQINTFALNPSNKIIGSTDSGFGKEDLFELKGKINSQTKIFIDAHGYITTDGLHKINSNEKTLLTIEILKMLQTFSQGPINVIIESCYSGGIKINLKALNEGFFLVLSSKPGFKSHAFHEMYSKVLLTSNAYSNNQEFYQNILNKLPYFIARSNTFVINEINLNLNPTFQSILNKEAARDILNKHADEFISLIKVFHNIELIKPTYNEQIIEEYQNLLFINSCALGEKEWINYFEDNLCLFSQNKYLINNNITGYTALRIAAEGGHIEIVNKLLKADADVNKPNTTGFTPLFVAAQDGYKDIVELLLSANADPNKAITDNGITPLIVALSKGYADIVKLLLAAGADPNLVTFDRGISPLMMATENGLMETVKLLLAAKAKVDHALTDTNETALHFALYIQRNDIAELLLKCGADPLRKFANSDINNIDNALLLASLFYQEDSDLMQQLKDIASGKLRYTQEDCIVEINGHVDTVAFNYDEL